MTRPPHPRSIAIVIATKGRPTISDTVTSALTQMRAYDELIVVFDVHHWDNYTSTVRRVTHAQRKKTPHHSVYTTFCTSLPNDQGHGYQQRTEGMRYANRRNANRHTQLLAFIDDDQIYLPGALDKMRRSNPQIPTIYKMNDPQLGTLWYHQELAYGNVATPMFVVPNKLSKLGRWKAHTVNNKGGDYTFITETVEKTGGVEWVDHVVSLNKPNEESSSTL